MKTLPAARKRRIDTQWRRAAAAIVIPTATLWTAQAFGFAVPLDDDDVKLRWDNTVKYSGGLRASRADRRLAGASAGFVNNGDRNFDRGSLISNRFDILSELDFAYRRMGVRLSAAGWYDRAYMSRNDNPGPQQAGSTQAYDEFTRNVKDLHGHKAEVLDAFVYGSGNLSDETSASFRLGRHSFQWGESAFFGGNGIAGTMAPVDLIKATSVPGTAFKDLLMKVPQLSGTVSVGTDLSFAAYYQFRWEGSRLPAAGSYFSTQNYTGPGLAALEPHDRGQFGLMARYVPADGETEYGVYLTRFHAKTPGGISLERVANGPPPVIVPRAYYHQETTALGSSYTVTSGGLNVGAEASIRFNAALPSTPGAPVAPGVAGNETDTARYAIGRTAHAQVNFSYALPRTALFDEAVLRGELAWNRLLSVSHNPAALNPEVDRDAAGLQLQWVPTYRQVVSGLDLSVPVTATYVSGKSGALGPGLGVDGGGIFSIGVSATYLTVYSAGLTFTTYHGPTGLGAFDQGLRDRRFVSFFASTTF